MEDRLRKLKPVLDDSVLKDVKFSKKRRSAVMNSINTKRNPKLDILELLQVKRTGFELSRSLFARGVNYFQYDEGKLYILLHELEVSQYICGEWVEEEKYYTLSSKGLKYLQQSETRIPLSFFRQTSFEGDC